MRKYLALCFLVINLCATAQLKQQSAWQQSVDYKINVQLDDLKHFLHGDIVMDYQNNSPDDLTFIYIHLWPNGYKNTRTAFARQMMQNGETDFYFSKAEDKGYIDSIAFTEGEQPLQVEQTKNIDVIKVILTKLLKSGQSVTLKSSFRVKLPKVFSRLGHDNQDYFITQWYPKPAVYDVNGWNPMPYLNMGEFYSEFGSFEVNITLPENYTLVATGECQNPSELIDYKKALGDSIPSSAIQKTVTFTADNVHDFAWFASKRWGYVSKKIKVADETVTARVVSAKPNVNDLDHIETAVSYYSENVGPYPYSHVTVVHGELKAGGGMEYPMITLCDFMGEEVIVHEVGHNWFYGILANNERSYPWMDESINSYYEQQAMAKGNSFLSNANAVAMNSLVKDNLLRNEHQAVASSSEELTNGNYGMSVYGIGASSFGYLEAFLGDSLFKACMLQYYDQWKYKHPLPDDMKISWEKTSCKNLSWFFDELLNSDTKMDYAICNHKEGFKLHNKSKIEVPVPVEMDLDGVKSRKWYSVPAGEKLILPVQADSKRAVIDPNKETLDMHLGNNSSHRNLEFKLGSRGERAHLNRVFVLPTYAWNYCDKSMWGLSIHNYGPSNKQLQYNISPMYSFENATVNGFANVHYTTPFSKPAEHMEIGADLKSFTFEPQTSLILNDRYRYTKVSPYAEYYLRKRSLRSLISRSFRFQYDFIGMDPKFDVDRGDTLSGNQFIQGDRQFMSLTYNKANKRKLNGYNFQLSIEYGQVSTNGILADFENPQFYDLDSVRRYFSYLRDEVTTEDMIRLTSVLNYDLDIGLQDKPLEIRVYGSFIANSINATTYQNTIGDGDRAGYYDYRFDDYLMHRNAESGLFQNQISNRRDFSKFVGGPLISNETRLVSANLTMPLPGKLPIKPYVEFVMADGLDEAFWNSSGAGLIYNAGLELELIEDRFEIFFNLWQSEDVSDFQNLNFGEKITFVFDLNGLRFDKLKKGLKLF